MKVRKSWQLVGAVVSPLIDAQTLMSAQPVMVGVSTTVPTLLAATSVPAIVAMSLEVMGTHVVVREGEG